MSTHGLTAGMYEGLHVVGTEGWYYYDGRSILSFGHPRASAQTLLALFNEPKNLTEEQRKVWQQNAHQTLTWEFVAGQMRLYDHWFDSNMKRQPILNTLRSHARFGEVPARIRKIKWELKKEWDAKFGNDALGAPTGHTTEQPRPCENNPSVTDVEACSTSESDTVTTTMGVHSDGPSAIELGAEDPEPIFHNVLPGQGLAASRWHCPATPSTDIKTVTVTIKVHEHGATSQSKMGHSAPVSRTTLTTQGLSVRRPIARVKGLAASRHNPDHHKGS